MGWMAVACVVLPTIGPASPEAARGSEQIRLGRNGIGASVSIRVKRTVLMVLQVPSRQKPVYIDRVVGLVMFDEKHRGVNLGKHLLEAVVDAVVVVVDARREGRRLFLSNDCVSNGPLAAAVSLCESYVQ